MLKKDIPIESNDINIDNTMKEKNQIEKMIYIYSIYLNGNLYQIGGVSNQVKVKLKKEIVASNI
jgi:hypothetical protein